MIIQKETGFTWVVRHSLMFYIRNLFNNKNITVLCIGNTVSISDYCQFLQNYAWLAWGIAASVIWKLSVNVRKGATPSTPSPR